MTQRVRRAMRVTSVLTVIALLALAGCLGGPAADDANASDAPSADADPDADPAFVVQIVGGNRTLDADEDGQASAELRYDRSGGEVTETSWDTIESPSGSSTGVLDYDDHAELRFTGEGEYVVQLTATSADGDRARDTTTITVE